MQHWCFRKLSWAEKSEYLARQDDFGGISLNPKLITQFSSVAQVKEEIHLKGWLMHFCHLGKLFCMTEQVEEFATAKAP